MSHLVAAVLFIAIFVILQAPAESQDSCEEDKCAESDEAGVQWR